MSDYLFLWVDKSGRGESSTKITMDMIINSEDETNWHGESLHEWVKDAEPGDVFEDSTFRYTCINPN